MKLNSFTKTAAALAAGSFLLVTLVAFAAAEAKSYQVTGAVLEVTPTKIVVQKGDEKWELTRTKKTKSAAEPKVGSKVTVYYTMVAEEIEAKDAKDEKKK